MQPTLTSDRLTLRPWTDQDAETVLDMYSRLEVMRYIGRTPILITDLAQARALIQRWQTLATEEPYGAWAIVPRGSSAAVGNALLKILPASGSGAPSADTEVGWHLHPDVWGRGYATEAGRRLLELAWENGLNQVFAVTNPANAASQAVCARLGMSALGLTDAYYDATCSLFVTTNPAAAA